MTLLTPQWCSWRARRASRVLITTKCLLYVSRRLCLTSSVIAPPVCPRRPPLSLGFHALPSSRFSCARSLLNNRPALWRSRTCVARHINDSSREPLSTRVKLVWTWVSQASRATERGHGYSFLTLTPTRLCRATRHAIHVHVCTWLFFVTILICNNWW